jgi:glucokinase
MKKIIAWDLGATKCAAGIVEYVEETKTFHCTNRVSVKLMDTSSLDGLIQQLESKLDFNMADADAICIGAAGQYNGEFLLLENAYPYSMSFAATAQKHHWPAFAVIHDYAPIVCATFTSYMTQPNNVTRLNNCEIQPLGRRVALGIGTGLGLKDGVLFPNGDFWLGKNEIGHIGINHPPSANTQQRQRHNELMAFLQSKSPITFEKILSGQGIVNLHQFFYPSETFLTPEDVGQRMRNGQANEVLDAFAWYLGLLVGTVQLIFMPEGGIWITGGVTLNHLGMFARPDFEAAIYASPAYLEQRNHYPLGILCNQEHALIGGAYYAVKRLGVTCLLSGA